MNENFNDTLYAPILAAISRKEESLFLLLAKERAKIEPNELISKIRNYPHTTQDHIDWIEKLISDKKYVTVHPATSATNS